MPSRIKESIAFLSSAKDTLDNMLLIVQGPHLKCHLARAYADVSIALEKMKGGERHE